MRCQTRPFPVPWARGGSVFAATIIAVPWHDRREYNVKYPGKTLNIIIYQMPDGKIEQYLVVEE